MQRYLSFTPAVFAALFLTGCFDGGDDDGQSEAPEMTNRAPSAVNASFITEADIAVADMLDASDADNDTLIFMLESEPSNGTLTLDLDGSFNYLPAATFTGSDSFSFSVSDGELSSGIAQVNITINAQQVSFDTYSRAAFNQSETDTPLPIAGREFNQDVMDENAYDDLLMN